MSEFKRTPESMRAELEYLDFERARIDDDITKLVTQRTRGEITEKQFDLTESLLGKEGDRVNSSTYEVLLTLKDFASIEARLAAYAESIAEEMGDEMPISSSEMLLSTFGVYEPGNIPTEIEEIIMALSDKYPIFLDDEASEQEGIKADPDWEPNEE